MSDESNDLAAIKKLLKMTTACVAVLTLLSLLNVALTIDLIKPYRKMIQAHGREAVNIDLRSKAMALVDARQYEEAEAFLLKNLDEHPGDPMIFYYLGEVYYHLKRYDEALKNFQKAAQIAPQWDEDWIQPFVRKIRLEMKSLPSG